MCSHFVLNDRGPVGRQSDQEYGLDVIRERENGFDQPRNVVERECGVLRA